MIRSRRTVPVETGTQNGSVQSLDWNGGMDWWTGLMSQQIMEKRNRVA